MAACQCCLTPAHPHLHAGVPSARNHVGASGGLLTDSAGPGVVLSRELTCS